MLNYVARHTHAQESPTNQSPPAHRNPLLGNNGIEKARGRPTQGFILQFKKSKFLKVPTALDLPVESAVVTVNIIVHNLLTSYFVAKEGNLSAMVPVRKSHVYEVLLIFSLMMIAYLIFW